jgi:hypothetical protein
LKRIIIEVGSDKEFLIYSLKSKTQEMPGKNSLTSIKIGGEKIRIDHIEPALVKIREFMSDMAQEGTKDRKDKKDMLKKMRKEK